MCKCTELSHLCLCWLTGAWIDVVGLFDPISDPPLTEYRASPDTENTAGLFANSHYPDYVVAPGCWMAAATSGPINPCPHGVTFWSYIEFEVPYGFGGAVFTTGPAAISILNTSFVDNNAGSGSNIKVVGANSLSVKSSDIAVGTVQTTVGIASCGPGSCELGQQCTQAGLKEGIFCNEPCGGEFIDRFNSPALVGLLLH